jgi:uncharacterized repeat protein (TIGR01451 family)
VTLSDALIEDEVDDDLTVTGVSGTAGADADSDVDVQTVEWLISSLAPGDSATITVNFTVASDVEEANGEENLGEPGLNDDPNVPNSATVAAEAPQGDPDDTGDDITNGDQDSIDIVVEIDISIVKTFDPTQIEMPQGTLQTFTIEVSNAGPSDAVGVSVSDIVDDRLEVTSVSVVPLGSGECTDSTGQNVDCTVQIPTGESVTVTVEYMTAPFLDEDSPYETLGGDDFYFVFLNGSILEGSTAQGGIVIYTAPGEEPVDITNDVTIVTSLTRNDIIFDPPGPDPAFELHLSCSDPFTGGWGQSGGPIEGVDTNWQIAYFTVARFNNNGFLKSCGNVVNDFEVWNTADASGDDTFGTQDVSDDAKVTIGPGIIIDRLQTKGKRLTVRLNNLTGDDKVIEDISVIWPVGSNGDLNKVWLTHGSTSDVIWQGTLAGGDGDDNPATPDLDLSVTGWIGATLFTGEAILRFDFQNKVASTGYVIRVRFEDGTWLDISVDGGGNNAPTKVKSPTTVIPYPIPIEEELNLKIDIDYKATVNAQLFDMVGRLVLNFETQLIESGSNTLKYNIPSRVRMSDTPFILRIYTGKEVIIKKIIFKP